METVSKYGYGSVPTRLIKQLDGREVAVNPARPGTGPLAKMSRRREETVKSWLSIAAPLQMGVYRNSCVGFGV